MKILAFADLHSDILEAKKLILKGEKEKVDFFVCAGDISEFENGLESLIVLFSKSYPLIIIPGNHESPKKIAELSKKHENVFDINKTKKVVDRVLFVGSGGGGFSLFDGILEKSKTKLKNHINEFRRKNPRGKVVLVTHAPPFNTKLDDVFGNHVGAENIRNFIENTRPDFCICGHIHETAGLKDTIGKTKIVNPGKKGIVLKL